MQHPHRPQLSLDLLDAAPGRESPPSDPDAGAGSSAAQGVRSAGKRPQVSRYTRLQQELRDSLFSDDCEWVDVTHVTTDFPIYNCADLFSGCGGLSLGFHMAGYSSCFGVEIDPDAAATYRHNFRGSFLWARPVEELTENVALDIMDGRQLHVLLAGFPCQGFSVAGARNPRDRRNSLYQQVIRLAKVLKPSMLVMENVPGILTISGGRVFEAIREDFAAIGYPLSVQILESADYGVAQYRPRTIMLGNRFGMKNYFPKPLLDSRTHLSIEQAIDDLKHVPRDEGLNHEWTRHSDEMERRLSDVEPGCSLYETYADAWKRQYRGRPSMTIKENHGGTHIHYELNRTLSAREMARLQSFPDDFFFQGRMKRVMFQVGNAVPPLLAKSVGLATRLSLSRFKSHEVEQARGPDS